MSRKRRRVGGRFVTAFCRCLCRRIVARIGLPSTKRPVICARFSVLRRLILTVVLEVTDGRTQPMVWNADFFQKSGRYAVSMSSVHDVASYILHKQGRMSTWKLQKLIYYSLAWSLVWDDEEPLFDEPIQAWANGPVCPELYRIHKREFAIDDPWPRGDWRSLSSSQRGTVDAVLKYYGKHSGHWLSELTHRETPWKKAREGLPAKARGKHEITRASMSLYYSSL
jgi:uncharacterized phage-associated protein